MVEYTSDFAYIFVQNVHKKFISCIQIDLFSDYWLTEQIKMVEHEIINFNLSNIMTKKAWNSIFMVWC
jgi:hypothetical protein